MQTVFSSLKNIVKSCFGALIVVWVVGGEERSEDSYGRFEKLTQLTLAVQSVHNVITD